MAILLELYTFVLHQGNVKIKISLLQITCSPTVQDSTDDLNIFEVSPANDVIVPALVELIAHYKWKKLALIVENKQEYTEVILLHISVLERDKPHSMFCV